MISKKAHCRCHVVLTCWLASLLCTSALAAGDKEAQELYHAILQPSFADSAWEITDRLTLQRPDFILELESGRLFVLSDHQHQPLGLIFEGRAHASFTPAPLLEREQLQRFAKDSSVVCTTSRVLLRFVRPQAIWFLDEDGDRVTLAGLQSRPRHKAEMSKASKDLPKVLQEGFMEGRAFNLAAYLTGCTLSQDDAELLLCAFIPDRDRHLYPPHYIYLHDRRAHENVSFFQYFPKRLKSPLYTACSYASDNHVLEPQAEAPTLTKYTGWIELHENGQIEADIGINLTLGKARPRHLAFSLSPELKVAWVISEESDTLTVLREKREADVTVLLPARLLSSDTLRLLFHYRGDILHRHSNGTFFLKDAVYWVPRLGYLERAHYQIVYKYPAHLQVLAVGRLVRDWEEAGKHLRLFKTMHPAKAATFCMGRFKADTLESLFPNLPAIEVYTTLRRSRGERRNVARDVANSIYFFQQLVHDYDMPVIRVVEAPTPHSQGFPGFVTLSWVGFFDHLKGPSEALRSHEIAHQWFGNMLGWSTYHDQWLSEAFAEYLGALYVDWVLHGEQGLSEILKAWRNDILDQGNIGVSLGMQRFGLSKEALRDAEGLKSGPIWMGTRLGQKEVMDYYIQTYEKGAYVLHMLRALLLDPENGSDARFWSMLAEYMKQHQLREPMTAAFQRVAEKYYGASLDWFFRQWVYGTQVPTYNWKYEVQDFLAEPAQLPLARPPHLGVSDRIKQYVARVEVQQEGVALQFKMPVPITIEYTDGYRHTANVWIDEAGSVWTSPPYTADIKQVIFNSGDAVLCRVKAY